MDRRVLAVVGGVLTVIVVAVLAVLFLMPRDDPGAGPTTMPTSSATGSPADPPAAAPSTGAAAPPGAYVEYSEQTIAAAEGRVLLFFHAGWCPQCRSIESDIEVDGVPPGYTIVKVDFDSRQDLRERYGVTLQTTFVEVDEDGTELGQHVAYDEPRLDAVLAAFG